MYIVAIAWIYVTLLMALTETSFVAGAATFLFYGLFPLTILLWLLGTPERRRRRKRAAERSAPEPAHSDVIDPDQRCHSSAGSPATVGPESTAIAESAQAAPANARDPGR